MKIRARMWRMPRTEHVIDHDDLETAADEYVAAHVDTKTDGAIAFVEVLDGEQWVLWRVEVLMPRPMLLLGTSPVTEEEAAAELRQKTIRGAALMVAREWLARVRSVFH